MKMIHCAILILFWTHVGLFHCAQAATATFSQDGQSIYFIGETNHTGCLSVLHLNHPDHFDDIVTSVALGGEDLQGITGTGNGSILCMSAHHLTSFDPPKRKLTKYFVLVHRESDNRGGRLSHKQNEFSRHKNHLGNVELKGVVRCPAPFGSTFRRGSTGYPSAGCSPAEPASV